MRKQLSPQTPHSTATSSRPIRRNAHLTQVKIPRIYRRDFQFQINPFLSLQLSNNQITPALRQSSYHGALKYFCAEFFSLA